MTRRHSLDAKRITALVACALLAFGAGCGLDGDGSNANRGDAWIATDSDEADGEDSCPPRYSVTEGTACSKEGKKCGYGTVSCGTYGGQDKNIFTCLDGKWKHTGYTDPPCLFEDAGGAGDPGDAVDPVDAGSVSCGNKTCGPDQYCQIQECCGVDVGFNDAGEWRGSPTYSCIDVPQSCNPGNACGCDSVCDCEGPRTVSCPAI